MNTANVTLRRADEETLGYVEDLLMRNDLPAEDVRENPGAFYVARTGDERVGAGGIEQYGADGLLRSVVVEEHARGEGVGTELCVALEATAREGGVERLFLLTTTAAGFFAGRGYTVGHKQADTRCFVWRSTRRLDGETPTSVFTYLCPTV